MGPALSTMAVIYTLLGGAGTLIGPVLGTAFIEILSYWLADVEAIRAIWPIVLGVVLLLAVTFQPSGLLGILVTARERIGTYGHRGHG
jgi:branched-chain amino acid transport system permease protein